MFELLILLGATGGLLWAGGRERGRRDRLPGGKADKRKSSDFNKRQLSKGVTHEMEHTSDRRVAREIAMDHLAEHPNYYTELENAEKTMKKPRRAGKRRR